MKWVNYLYFAHSWPSLSLNLVLFIEALVAELILFLINFFAAHITNIGAVHVGTSSKEGSVVRKQALRLISDGLESNLIYVLEGLLFAMHPKEMVCLISCPPLFICMVV